MFIFKTHLLSKRKNKSNYREDETHQSFFRTIESFFLRLLTVREDTQYVASLIWSRNLALLKLCIFTSFIYTRCSMKIEKSTLKINNNQFQTYFRNLLSNIFFSNKIKEKNNLNYLPTHKTILNWSKKKKKVIAIKST